MPAGKNLPTTADSKPHPLYKVFVSSTYRDNEERRKLVQDAITTAGMLWHGMEIFTASTKPTVEECLRHAREADVLVGIIARRYGWVPDGSEISITEMEYDTARERLMFLIDPSLPFTEDDLDPPPDCWDKQKKLEVFVQRIKKDQMPAVFNEKKLHGKVLDSLNKWRDRRERGNQPPPPELDHRRLLEDYLQELIVATKRIDIQGIHSATGSGRKLIYFPIEQHYTPLKTGQRMPPEPGDASEEGLAKATAERVPLTDLLSSQQRLLVIGEPGGGKTTFLRFIACVLAKDALGTSEPGRKRHLGLSLEDPPLVPIFIRLSVLAGILKKSDSQCSDTGRWCDLLCALKTLFGEEKALILEDLLDHKRCALLLDGLDEEPDPKIRRAIVAVVDSALHHWEGNLIVISSRPFGYHAIAELEQMAVAHIDSFSREEIADFLRRWAAALFPDEAERARRSYLPELQAAVMNVSRIRRMAKNPVMLTCLCVVHWNEKHLPEGKADLLMAVLRWLLDAKEEKRQMRGYSNTFAGECFKTLALAMTRHPQGKQVQADLAWAAEKLAVPFRDELGITGQRLRTKGMAFLEAEMLDSGIVEQAGTGQLRFWHLTFQEHYAASALVELDDDDGPQGWWQVLAPHLGDRQWEEVLEHFAGCLARTGRRRLNLLIERILKTADSRGDLASLAGAVGVLGRILRILTIYDYEPPQRLGWERAKEQVMSIFTTEGASQVPVAERIRAAEALGQTGDPRFENQESEMLPIRGMTNVLLGKYPVTVAQYRCFVESKGYDQPQVWGEDWKVKEAAGWSEPAGWDDQEPHSNRPATGVSWYEAVAYCRWLTIRGDNSYRLPTSDEWQMAATNPKGDYPWGKATPNAELLNFNLNIGNPTPVGVYPAGVAPGGHLDLAGNVWEWVRDSRAALRVLRGGGWGYGARYCRSATRDSRAPDYRYPDVGFRLARSVALGS